MDENIKSQPSWLKYLRLLVFLLAVIVISLFVYNYYTSLKPENKVWAIVNGKKIFGKDLIEASNDPSILASGLNSKTQEILDALIEKKVISYESERLKMTEEELFEFFNLLKTRNISDTELKKYVDQHKDLLGDVKNKTEILELVRQRQFESAKLKYISELKNRSTIKVLYSSD